MTWKEKKQTLQAIYERFESDARAYKQHAICRIGCTYCCTDVGNVDINTLEGLVIRERIKTLPQPLKGQIQKKLAQNKREKEKQNIAPCPFLKEDDTCLIYDIRPFSCRQLYSVRECRGRGPTVHRQAVALAKKAVFAGFDETVELHLRMGVDSRSADQQVRGVALLPSGLGKQVRVLVFAQGEGARLANEANADHVGSDDIIKKIEEGWLDFDISIATPDMMGKVGKLGKILGRKGLMPNPKSGTVVASLTSFAIVVARLWAFAPSAAAAFLISSIGEESTISANRRA